MRRFPTAIFGKNGFEDAACNSLHKKLEECIMSEIGFFSLKAGTSFQTREKPKTFATTEDNNPTARKRNILVLIHHYLLNLGYHDTCRTLEIEADANLRQHTLCDEIDLDVILREFEAHHFAKYQRYPRIVKPAKDIGHKSHWYDIRFANGVRTVSFPNIDGRHRHITPHCCLRKSTKSANKPTKPSTEVSPVMAMVDGESGRALPKGPTAQPIHPESRPPTTGKQTSVQKRNSIPASLQGPEELLDLGRVLGKPLRGLANEWTDLMQIVSKDIYQADPNVKWDDIVGLDEAKRLIQEAVVYPIKYPQLFRGILSPWRGLLLYGPPGTGKTLLAKAVATECNTTFFNVSASTLVSKWRGESEKLVRVLFEMARSQAPSTIFLDELDSLVSHRGSSDGSNEHEGSRRMKTELLVQMDGLASSDDLVFVLAASNLPWELDCAMLRRLEKRIFVHLPNKEARRAMFEQHLPPTVCRSEDYGLELTSNLNYDALAENSEEYSGSDIRLVCKESAMQRLRQILAVLGNFTEDEMKEKKLTLDPIVTENVVEAMKRTKPSATTFSHKYLEWQKRYESA